MALRGTRSGILLAAAGLVVLFMGAAAGGDAQARPATCFGKKINRVVNGSNRTVKLKFRDVAWIAGDRVTVFAKPYTVLCADKGRQTVYAGKGTSKISTGADDDRIFLNNRSNRNLVQAGLGNDYVRGSKGHDTIYASPRTNPAGLPDRDEVHGLGGNDRIYDFSGIGNRLFGDDGSDTLHSLGDAVSSVYGGNGSDFLFTTGGRSGGMIDRLFGERGNDRLRGDRAPTRGPAFLDGGPGDDWIYGTDQGDTIISRSGITKINARGGDDLVIASSRGVAKIDGGGGNDTVSYAAHTPPDGGRGGVMVNLSQNFARGLYSRAPTHSLRNIQNVEGSPFDDVLIGKSGVANRLDGGLGDDELAGDPDDLDRADGGLGQNDCEGFTIEVNCNAQSPGKPDGSKPVIDMNRGGVLTIVGSRMDDRITVGYDRQQGGYVITVDRTPVFTGQCSRPSASSGPVLCEAPASNLNGVVLHGGQGDDRLEIANSVPPAVTTGINGGTGKNILIGGRSKDYMETANGRSSGSVLEGRGNSDVIYVDDRVTVRGGPGSDVFPVRNVCRGAVVSGGPGSDNLVFAIAPRGVDADLARGSARLIGGSCKAPLRMSHDIEGIEGSRHSDRLKLGRRFPGQQGKLSLLGRDGSDRLDSRNGSRDSVITGSGGHRNKVIADPIDKVIWGWGLAAF